MTADFAFVRAAYRTTEIIWVLDLVAAGEELVSRDCGGISGAQDAAHRAVRRWGRGIAQALGSRPDCMLTLHSNVCCLLVTMDPLFQHYPVMRMELKGHPPLCPLN